MKRSSCSNKDKSALMGGVMLRDFAINCNNMFPYKDTQIAGTMSQIMGPGFQFFFFFDTTKETVSTLCLVKLIAKTPKTNTHTRTKKKKQKKK